MIAATTTREDLEARTTHDLRDMARQAGHTGSAIVSARKADLINLLIHGSPIPGQSGATPSLFTRDDANEEPRQPRQATPTPQPPDDLADTIARALAGRIGAQIDPDQVREIATDAMAPKLAQLEAEIRRRPAAQQVIIDKKPGPEIDEETHPQFALACRLIGAGLPVLMVGPAGTGKTTLAAQVARALERKFTYNSMSAGVSESHILGRTLPDAEGNWKYQPSPFVSTYEHGGLHLFDEIDAADPNLLVIINAALANGHLSLPFENRTVERHPTTAIMAGANTYGHGADRQYAGRNQLDAATLDRFALSTIEIHYDERLEARLIGAQEGPSQPQAPTGTPPTPDELHDWIKTTRAKIAEAGLRRIMSMRSAVNAAALARAGFALDEIKGLFFTGWSADEKRRVE